MVKQPKHLQNTHKYEGRKMQRDTDGLCSLHLWLLVDVKGLSGLSGDIQIAHQGIGDCVDERNHLQEIYKTGELVTDADVEFLQMDTHTHLTN